MIHESIARDTITYLESTGQSHCLDRSPLGNRRGRTFRNTSSNNSASKLMRAAILAAYPGLDLRNFKELSAEATIMTGLEKELLRFDEIGASCMHGYSIVPKFPILDTATLQIWRSQRL